MSRANEPAEDEEVSLFELLVRPDDEVLFAAPCRLRLQSGGRVHAEVAVVTNTASPCETA